MDFTLIASEAGEYLVFCGGVMRGDDSASTIYAILRVDGNKVTEYQSNIVEEDMYSVSGAMCYFIF